ncbi:MAG TPA: pantoate--beta-alanine ligase, partial [Acidimicrobiales bacterium]|nr:pantoate--beta-alanine ligase [Acidimicrobiales bacterium]
TESAVALDYAVAVDATTLDEVDTISDPAAVRLLLAAQVGPVRLIDNSGALDGADAPSHTAHDGAVPARQLERTG